VGRKAKIGGEKSKNRWGKGKNRWGKGKNRWGNKTAKNASATSIFKASPPVDNFVTKHIKNL